jgi:predicted RNase H-related nuclease YkuK (DUF458 family)
MAKWQTLSGEDIPDIAEFVEAETRNGQIVHIGCDSLQAGRFTGYVTVVIILNTPKGGRVAYLKERTPRESSLRKRLSEEVWRSVSLALELKDHVASEIQVHIDVNPNPKFKSGAYIKELSALVVSQGFGLVVKPNAFAASHAADWCVRH